MTIYHVHPDSPQQRLLEQVSAALHQGAVLVYPTDTGYALGCQPGNASAIERIRCLRGLDKKHFFSLVCHDLTQVAEYAYLSNAAFKLIKRHIPGPFTFILQATRETPKRLLHPKRRTIGIHIPDNCVLLDLLRLFGEPLLSVSLRPQTDELHNEPLYVEDLVEVLNGEVDHIIDVGPMLYRYSTVVDLTEAHADIIRQGAGNITDL